MKGGGVSFTITPLALHISSRAVQPRLENPSHAKGFVDLRTTFPQSRGIGVGCCPSQKLVAGCNESLQRRMQPCNDIVKHSAITIPIITHVDDGDDYHYGDYDGIDDNGYYDDQG